MSNRTIRTAFESRLATWADKRYAVSFVNVPFVPPQLDGKPAAYLSSFFIPNRTENDDLERKLCRFEGLYQVTAVLPQNAGVQEAESIELAMQALFPTARPMSQNGLLIFITSPMSLGPYLQRPDALEVPISCQYRADA